MGPTKRVNQLNVANSCVPVDRLDSIGRKDVAGAVKELRAQRLVVDEQSRQLERIEEGIESWMQLSMSDKPREAPTP